MDHIGISVRSHFSLAVQLPTLQTCGMPSVMLYGQPCCCTEGEMLEGAVSGMDESYWKP